jgi:hypothetical protein
MPDNAYDLAVVDPPYGAGFTEGGGCQGWFAKYHQDSGVERERETADRSTTGSEVKTAGLNATSGSRFGNPGSRFERYKTETNEKKS